MPITQSRMIDMVLIAEEVLSVAEGLALRIREAAARAARGGPEGATQALAELEWYGDLINNFPSPSEFQRKLTTLALERKWYDRNAAGNERRALRARVRRGGASSDLTTTRPTGPAVSHHDISAHAAAPTSKPGVQQRGYTPSYLPRGIAEEVKIAEYAEANGVDHEMAAGILGYEMRGASPETDGSDVQPLVPDEDPEDFSGLGEGD